MNNTIKATWNLLIETIDATNVEIQLNEGSYDVYKEKFNYWYYKIKNDYMKQDVNFLDRHKVAGIIIVSILQSNIITCTEPVKANKIFIGQHLIAGSVGITYMQDRLNEQLIEKGKQPVERIWMPECIFSCDVPYFDIFCRNLYFAEIEKEWGLNPLEIAKELFLLEYVTIEKHGINPVILKEKKG